jgi:hypothetical protein
VTDPLAALVQVFATVHSSGHERLNLSPATLSRFTTIRVCEYSLTDLQQVLQQQLQAQLCRPGGGGKERAASAAEVQHLLDTLCSLQAHVTQELRVPANIRQLLRCVQFVAAHVTEPYLLKRLLVGFRWLVLDALCAEPDRQQQLAASWLGLLQTDSSTSGRSSNLVQLQEAVEAAFQAPDQHGMQDPAQLLWVVPDGRLQLSFTGVAAARAPARPDASTASAAVDPAQLLRLSCTPWLVISMARIIAAATVQGPLLLEGAPGIGKTAVVQEVSRLLGYGCERINLSSNTSLDQLLGSFIPRMIDGQRVFAWHDGVMVRAIREHKWLLLDEINLAQPEVLAAIAPLLDR